MNQNAETELMLEGDDDAVSLLQEKEIDNLAGTCLSVVLLFVNNNYEVTEFNIYLLVNKCVPVVGTVLENRVLYLMSSIKERKIRSNK